MIEHNKEVNSKYAKGGEYAIQAEKEVIQIESRKSRYSFLKLLLAFIVACIVITLLAL